MAILSVVLFHAFPSALPGGFIGVDIFFVISGFLISSIVFRSLQRGNFSFAEFYARRIQRIFPALIVVLAACYGFGWFALLPDEFKQLGKHMAAGAGFAQNFVLSTEAGYFDTASELKPLLHLWSLAIEEQFYLAYPLLIFIAWRVGLNLLTVIAVLGVLSFALNVTAVAQAPASAFFMPQPRFWELLAGSALAYLQLFKAAQPRMSPRWVPRGPVSDDLVSALGLLLLVAAAFGITRDNAFPGYWALVPVAGAVLLILAGPEPWANRVLLANKLMVFVGLISYPLYLWHWPILSFARIVESGTPAQEIRIAAVALSFALAWLTYRLVEKPIRFGRQTWIKPVALSVVLALAGYIGYHAFQRNGLAFRVPEEVRHIVNVNYEYAQDARAGRCWLSQQESADGFGGECIAVPRSAESHAILLWGDSHAARLYPGLRATMGDRIALSQLTRNSCPPILGFGYTACRKGNDHVVSQIRNLVPTTVVMFAAWNRYQKAWPAESAAGQALLETIRSLKQLGIKNIVVLGPAPEWNDALPRLVYKAWKDSLPRRIPERLTTGMKPEVREVDMRLQEMFRSEQVRYVSVLQILCRQDGCLTHVPGTSRGLLTWDYGHLTTEGAVFVSQHLSIAGILP